MKTLRRSSNKRITVTIQTMDAEMEFEMSPRSYGRELMTLVCRTIGLRETWYFGLQFFDSKGYLNWLKDDKRLCDQDVSINLRPSDLSLTSVASTTSSNSSTSNTSNISSTKNASSDSKKPHMVFLFLAKFYPEDVAAELIQEVTHHLFYLQVKQAILDEKIFCPPEASVLLASYAVQAKYGDYDKATYKPGMLAEAEDLLPQRVIDQHQMTSKMWEERIRVWYADHKGMSSDEAELEYLKIAHDLDMYGVNYFQITKKHGTKLWLGVTAIGLHMYDLKNQLTPKVTFPWSEIKNISYDDKKFIIKTTAKKSRPVCFYSEKTRMNKLILDLCIGNHDLYMKRRQPDSMELQQMKAQAREEQLRRAFEREKLAREKELRQAAEREKAEMEARLIQYQEEVRTAQEQLRKSEEFAELLDEKVRMAEEESLLFSQKSAEAEAEMQRIRINAMKTEEEKLLIERKAVEVELVVSSMLEESEFRAKETEALRVELLKAKLAEKEAKDKLIDVLRASSSPAPASLVINSPSAQFASPTHISNDFGHAHHQVPIGLHSPPPINHHQAHHQSQQLNNQQAPTITSSSSGHYSTNPCHLQGATNGSSGIYLRNLNGHSINSVTNAIESSSTSSVTGHPTHLSQFVTGFNINGTSSSSLANQSILDYVASVGNSLQSQRQDSVSTGGNHLNHSRSPSVESHSLLLQQLRAASLGHNSGGNNNSMTSTIGDSLVPIGSSVNNGGNSNSIYRHPITVGTGLHRNSNESNSSLCHQPASKSSLPLHAQCYSFSSNSSSVNNNGHCNRVSIGSTSSNAGHSSMCLDNGPLGLYSDVAKLTLEIEKERIECLEKSRNIQNQLSQLKSEIQDLKVEEKLTPLDRIHEENAIRGENKYSTLKRTKSGTTKARVSFFEAL